jgi:hypothetical protein
MSFAGLPPAEVAREGQKTHVLTQVDRWTGGQVDRRRTRLPVDLSTRLPVHPPSGLGGFPEYVLPKRDVNSSA